MLAAAALATAAAGAQDDGAPDRSFRVHVGQRLSDETNLYRLPAEIDPAVVLGDGAARDDTVTASSVGLSGEWERGRQGVVLETSVATNRFSRNGELDNSSGRGRLEWHWQVGSKWSAQLGGRRERSLASFANTDSLAKDVLDVTARQGEARFDATPRWSATLAAREATTEHGNALRSGDDVTTRNAAFAVLHHTPRNDSIGVELRGARGERADALVGGLPSASDYEEQRALLTLEYQLRAKLALEADAGRVERTYPAGARGDFSGDVWNLGLRWSVSPKTAIAVERWRDIKAHLDAESEHFLATGGALTASWSPTRPLRLALQASREQQRYIGLGAEALTEALRRDRPRSRGLTVTYAPRERFSLDAAYRRETRSSDRPRFDYAAESLAIAWDLRF
jgi:hypothetical protein